MKTSTLASPWSSIHLLPALLLGLATLLAVGATGCSPAASETAGAHQTPSLVSPAGFEAWQAQHPDGVVVDIRSAQEQASGVIPGVHRFADWNQGPGTLARALANVPKDRPVLLYCRSGARSSRAAKWLAGQGYEQVSDLRGGILAWNQAYPQTLVAVPAAR